MVTPTGPYIKADSSLAAYILATRTIMQPEETGDLPEWEIPSVPEGADA